MQDLHCTPIPLSLDEVAGKKLLSDFGISVPKFVVVKHHVEVDEAVKTLQFPLVVKVMSPKILHKSDVGGVVLNLNTVDSVKSAIISIAESSKIEPGIITGYLIEEMTSSGQEMVIGSVNDPEFGPLIMVGLGGIFVEVLADVSFRICPISKIDAEEMLSELKGKALLEGARGRKKISQEKMIDALLKIGGESGLLMQNFNRFSEVDINPLIVNDEDIVAVDARFILQPTH